MSEGKKSHASQKTNSSKVIPRRLCLNSRVQPSGKGSKEQRSSKVVSTGALHTKRSLLFGHRNYGLGPLPCPRSHSLESKPRKP